MKWNELKKKCITLKSKNIKIKHMDEDSIIFTYKNQLFKFHKFSIPDGFLLKNNNRIYYQRCKDYIALRYFDKNMWRTITWI
ncbi:MAG: hypothetical protein ACTSRP_12500 [Candidatus Helarchaeota archaeon]